MDPKRNSNVDPDISYPHVKFDVDMLKETEIIAYKQFRSLSTMTLP